MFVVYYIIHVDHVFYTRQGKREDKQQIVLKMHQFYIDLPLGQLTIISFGNMKIM